MTGRLASTILFVTFALNPLDLFGLIIITIHYLTTYGRGDSESISH